MNTILCFLCLSLIGWVSWGTVFRFYPDSGGIAPLHDSHEEDVHMSQIPRQKLRLGNIIDHILFITYSLF